MNKYRIDQEVLHCGHRYKIYLIEKRPFGIEYGIQINDFGDGRTYFIKEESIVPWSQGNLKKYLQNREIGLNNNFMAL